MTPTPRVALAQGYGALPLSVVVTGKFDRVARFLQRLRQQAAVDKHGRPRVDGRLLVANEISMTSSDGRTVSATLKLDAFVYGAGIAAPAVGPTGAAGATTAGSTG